MSKIPNHKAPHKNQHNNTAKILNNIKVSLIFFGGFMLLVTLSANVFAGIHGEMCFWSIIMTCISIIIIVYIQFYQNKINNNIIKYKYIIINKIFLLIAIPLSILISYIYFKSKLSTADKSIKIIYNALEKLKLFINSDIWKLSFTINLWLFIILLIVILLSVFIFNKLFNKHNIFIYDKQPYITDRDIYWK